MNRKKFTYDTNSAIFSRTLERILITVSNGTNFSYNEIMSMDIGRFFRLIKTLEKNGGKS